MANAHAQLIASLDDSQVTTALARMDQGMNKMSQRAQAAGRNMDQSFKRAGKLGNIAGDIAMSQLTSGAGMLVQQGAAIASVFGPTGALVGGLAAAAVLIWELVSGTAEAERQAERLNASLMKTARDNVRVLGTAMDAEDDAKVLDMERKKGKAAADQLREQLELQKKIRDIRNTAATEDIKNEAIAALEAKKNAQERMRDGQRRVQSAAALGQSILDRASEILAGPGAREDKRRQERLEKRAIRRAATEQVNEVDRRERAESGFRSEPKGLSPAERKSQVEARINAAKFQQQNKIQAEITKEGAQVVADAILKTITQ